MILAVYVPNIDSDRGFSVSNIVEGSGIVGSPFEDDLVKIDYEGGIYKQAGFENYANRVYHAAGRHTTNYPTVARAVVPADSLLHVGWFDDETRTVTVDNSVALESWIGEYDDDQLQVKS